MNWVNALTNGEIIALASVVVAAIGVVVAIWSRTRLTSSPSSLGQKLESQGTGASHTSEVDINIDNSRVDVSNSKRLHIGDAGAQYFAKVVNVTQGIDDRRSKADQKILFTLPPNPTIVIGREDDMIELKRRLGMSGELMRPYTVIRGLPGVGKSTAVFRLANEADVWQAFPDGVLWTHTDYVNENQRDSELDKANLMSKLCDWGRLLGNNEIGLCKTLDQAATHLRTLLHNKRMLLIVDDVWDARHAQLFKNVAGPQCATLFTTRETKIANALVDSPEDDVYLLGKLSDENGLALLKSIARSAVLDYPEECLKLIHELEGLPLSITVAGGLLYAEIANGFSPTDLIAELKHGLKLLTAGVPIGRPGRYEGKAMLTITVLLEKSTDRLDEEIRIRFAQLGFSPPKPATFELGRMSAVWAISNAKPTVQELVARGLLEPLEIGGQSRYQMHALLSLHAKNLLKTL